MVYQVVAARRLQFDNLVWQVPALSLTAQAFLFTIAIGGTTSRPARIIASLLAIVITVLCTTLMARHRQSEIHDANWLAAFEADEWKTAPAAGDLDFRVHGLAFREKRGKGSVDGGWTESIVRPLPGYKTWIAGLLVFGAAALVTLAVSICCPDVLLTPQKFSVAPTPSICADDFYCGDDVRVPFRIGSVVDQ